MARRNEEELCLTVVVGRGQRHDLDVALLQCLIGLHQAEVVGMGLERIDARFRNCIAKGQGVRSIHRADVADSADLHPGQEPRE